MKCIFLLLGVLLVFVSGAEQEIFMANGGAAGASCGTPESPCVSLEDSFAQVEETDIIISVAPGYYSGERNTNLDFPHVHVILQNTDPSDDVIFDCNLLPVGFKASSTLELIGITISNCTDTAVEFQADDATQTVKLTSVLISSCGSGLVSNRNIEIQNSKFSDVNDISSDARSGCGVFVQGLEIEQVSIQHSYFENIAKFSLFVDAPEATTVSVMGTEFLMTSGIRIASGSKCIGAFSASEFLAFAETQTAVEISGGDWTFSDVVTSAAAKGSCRIGIHLNNVRSAIIQNSQLYLGDTVLRATDSNFHILDSEVISVDTGIHVVFEDPETSNSISLEGSKIESESMSLLVDGTAPSDRSGFNFMSVSDTEFVNSNVEIHIPCYGRIHDTEFLGSESRALLVTVGGAWEFNGITVEQTGGIAFSDPTVSATFSQSAFVDNSGKEGGAIFFSGALLTLLDCTFQDNRAENNGGAVYLADQSDLTLQDVSFVDNFASNGAAVFCDPEGKSEVNGNGVELQDNVNEEEGSADIPCFVSEPQTTEQSSSTPLGMVIFISVSVGVILFAVVAIVVAMFLCVSVSKKEKETAPYAPL